jgi:hypothetical protein
MEQEGGMTETFLPGQAINLDLLVGTIFPCYIKTAQGLLNRYLGITDNWALELEAHKTRCVLPDRVREEIAHSYCASKVIAYQPDAVRVWTSSNLRRINWVTVLRAQELVGIQKLKFRRGISITILFKGKFRSRSVGLYLPIESVSLLQMRQYGNWRWRSLGNAWPQFRWVTSRGTSAPKRVVTEGSRLFQDHLSKQGIRGKKTTMAKVQQLDRAKDILEEVRRRTFLWYQ